MKCGANYLVTNKNRFKERVYPDTFFIIFFSGIFIHLYDIIGQ